MQQRPLGGSGLQVSVLGLGCSNLGRGLFLRDDAASLRLLRRAFEGGITCYDTADSYASGRSERLLGRAFRTRRREVVIVSKVGMTPSPLVAVTRMAKRLLGPMRQHPGTTQPRRPTPPRQNFSPQHIRAAIEGTLRRLRTDYVDLYLLHSPPMDILRRGEALGQLARLQREGRVRCYGVSASTIEDALLCVTQPGMAVVEVAFNAVSQEAAAALLPLAVQRRVGVIARVPLARGLLTDRGTLAPDRPRHTADYLRRARAARDVLASLSADGTRTVTQAALQFVLHHQALSTAIPGTRSIAHLDELLGTQDAPPLTDGDIARLISVR